MPLQLKFEANQAYQLDAIRAVTDVFEGQSLAAGEFELSALQRGLDFRETGVRNELTIDETAIAENVKNIQKRNGIITAPTPSDSPSGKGRGTADSFSAGEADVDLNFSVEMETGTGKTYVYLRTVYELHRQYGFSKFVIVVPSVAIREGVIQTIEMTREHFAGLYDRVPVDCFVYDSKKVGRLRGFASSTTLQIMIINIDAFNKKDIAVIHRDSDRLSGRRPIEFIQETRPIVIMDEPQNMESETAREAIAELRPLCTLRYSATHRNYYHLLYKLDPVKAYDLGLVKQIEVDSVLADADRNGASIEIVEVKAAKKSIVARMKIAVEGAHGVTERVISAKPGDDLFRLSGGREAYRDGFVIESIDAETGTVEFANGIVASKSERSDAERRDEVMKMQILETVREHLDKEKRVLGRGIKILSLFFVDRVVSYREYAEGGVRPGKLAQWFEEIYAELSREKRYRELDFPDVGLVHGGYFSQDKKGRAKDTNGVTQADNDTYALIMQEKERLLSLDEPLKFIFSHSALREGWDNPNVFQICTLNETRSELKKRQEIGRGMRLPVDATGARIFDPNINRLTVIANESYEDFARSLQQEIREDCGVDFGSDRIKSKQRRKSAKLRKGYALDPNFRVLWDRIKHQTRYRVAYDTRDLVLHAATAIGALSPINTPKIRASKAGLLLTAEGVHTEVRTVREASGSYIASRQVVPDMVGYLQGKTGLTASVLGDILRLSGRVGDVFKNPQEFLDRCIEVIDREMKRLLVDGVEYERVAGEGYDMSLFQRDKIWLYTNDKHVFRVDEHRLGKTLYDYLILDSAVESDFARELEAREEVVLYVKLPRWFKIKTPLGAYNPDWAVVFDGDARVYFVAETKGTSDIEALTPEERGKILCGRKHFAQLDAVKFFGPVIHLTDVRISG
jgi:type III restriction enzyme